MKTGLLLAGAMWLLLIVTIVCIAGCVSEGACEGSASGKVAISEPWPWGTDSQPTK